MNSRQPPFGGFGSGAAASSGTMELSTENRLYIRQRLEMAEFFGIETRNKYEILNSRSEVIGFAAEQGKSVLEFLARKFLGHWRRFQIHIFDRERRLTLVVDHPFRWWFQRLEVQNARGALIGAVQARFSIFHKKFDICDAQGRIIMEVASPLWRPWTFPFLKGTLEVASVKKKWSGGLTEIFTDKDNFLVEFSQARLSNAERLLVLSAAIFIDLQFFERRADS